MAKHFKEALAWQIKKCTQKNISIYLDYVIHVHDNSKPQVSHSKICLVDILEFICTNKTPTKKHTLRLLHYYADIFLEELPQQLPPTWKMDHQIKTLQDVAPYHYGTYQISDRELVGLNNQVDELILRGCIKPRVFTLWYYLYQNRMEDSESV